MIGAPVFRYVLTPGWAGDSLARAAQAVPSLDLNFAATKNVGPLITFTRASSATYVGSDGLIKTATTNLCLQSQDFSTTWTNFNSTESVNTATAPDGTLTADTLIPSNGATSGLIRQDFSGSTFTDNVSISFSIFVKAAGLTSFNIQFFNKANTFYGTQTINASTGALSGSGTLATTTVTPVSDGWFRVSATGMNTGSGATSPNVRFVVTSTGDGTSGIYLWGAQLEQSSTVGEYIPTTSTINSAPRFDHNPTTGESLGLLVEEQRTNSVTNNTMVGAVAGTPGTNPTGWVYATAQSNGLTISIVGTGVENGINYIDYRFNGTTVASPNPCGIGIVNATAATAQTWTASTYWKLAAGTTAGINAWQLGLIENTAGGTFVAGAFYPQTAPTSAALSTQRPTATRTLSGGGTVGMVTLPINIVVAGNTAIDFTLRIGLPQLEQGAFATSVIPTSTAAATRSADVASITGTNFSSWYRQDEGTVFARYSFPQSPTTGGGRVFQFTNAAATNVIWLRAQGGVNRVYDVTDASVSQANFNQGAYAAGVEYRAALATKANDFGFAENGGAPQSDSSGTMPSVNQLGIGIESIGNGSQGNVHIRRLTYWPQRLPNSTLQAITQ